MRTRTDLDDSILNFSGKDIPNKEDPEDTEEGPPMEEDSADEEGLMAMNGTGGQHGNGLAPCFWKFKHGKCTSAGCKMDHSEAAMLKLRNIRIMALVKSPYRPKTNELVTQFETYIKQQPVGRAQDNPKGKA